MQAITAKLPQVLWMEALHDRPDRNVGGDSKGRIPRPAASSTLSLASTNSDTTTVFQPPPSIHSHPLLPLWSSSWHIRGSGHRRELANTPRVSVPTGGLQACPRLGGERPHNPVQFTHSAVSRRLVFAMATVLPLRSPFPYLSSAVLAGSRFAMSFAPLSLATAGTSGFAFPAANNASHLFRSARS
jgi:hypothetical protein